MSRAQRTEGWAKRPRARVLAFLFLLVNFPYLSPSLCTSLVAPQRRQTRRLAVVSRFNPLFLILFLLFILWLGWVYGILVIFPFLLPLTSSRDLAQ